MSSFIRQCAGAAVGLALLGATARASGVFSVRDYGASGDGNTHDTAAITQAVKFCAASGGGQVVFPPGKYLTGTILLQSNVTLVVEAGAEIVGTPDLDRYRSYDPPKSRPAGSRWHRAVLLGIGVQNVTITGKGAINGNKVFDEKGEEKMRGPHAVLFANSRNITLREISIRDAANYAVMLVCTSQVEVRGVKITGGWDGVHFRGTGDDPCRDVSITDCEFYTGDDCIAGWHWENTLIARCIINSSCNGIRLIGPAKDLIIHDCLFFGPGRFEHRTSREKKRTNMLAGLCLQPGAWDKTQGSLDGVEISNITMHNVTTPLHLSLKPGNSAGRISINRLTATGLYRAAASIESWAETPIDKVILRDVSLEFAGGGTPDQAKQPVRAPGVDARPLPAWGLYTRNVRGLQLENVRLALDKPDARPMLMAENVGTITLDTFKFPQEGASMSLSGVEKVNVLDSAIPLAPHKCLALATQPTPPAAFATIEAPRDGLAKVELSADVRTLTRWAWVKSGQKTGVLFPLDGLPAGKHTLTCGDARAEIVMRE